MSRTRLLLGAVLVGSAALAACGPRISSTDFQEGVASQTESPASWSLADVVVNVPDEMEVEADGDVRYPPVDKLVWWGDPPGDRKAQVERLLADAARAGGADALTGSRPVALTIIVRQFHAMTPRARGTNLQLGVHEIKLDLAVIDAASGAVLAEEKGVNADLRAFSGGQALLAEQAGQGQKIRIQTRVAQVVRAWLTS